MSIFWRSLLAKPNALFRLWMSGKIDHGTNAQGFFARLNRAVVHQFCIHLFDGFYRVVFQEFTPRVVVNDDQFGGQPLVQFGSQACRHDETG